MGCHALKWVALCLWMVPAWSLAQPGTDVDRDVQRAILLGKAGEFARGLEAVEVHLDEDSRHAEAWFMSGFLLKEWYKQSDNRAHRQEAMKRLATSLDLQSAQGRPADWLPQARRALGYLGDDCYDDAVAAVNTFQTGDEVNVLALVDQYAPPEAPQGSDTLTDPASISDRQWRSYVGYFHRKGDWAGPGPRPDRDGCLAPQSVLDEFGFAKREGDAA